MTTTVSSISDIREKAGIVVRDILKADTTLVALIGRSADNSIFYGTPRTKTRFEPKYPYMRIDLLPSDYYDYSIDGELQEARIRLKITSFSPDQFLALKMADRAFNAITGAYSTLIASGLCPVSSSTDSTDEVMPDGQMLRNEGLTMNFNYIGSRS